MNYVQEIAKAIRRKVPDELIPDSDADALFILYAVLCRTKGGRRVQRGCARRVERVDDTSGERA